MFLPFIIEAFFPITYHGDYALIPILAMGYVFLGLRKITSVILAYYEKALWFSMSGYLPAILNVALNFIFIPQYGIISAALSTLASFFIYFLTVYLMSRKLVIFELDYTSLSILYVASVAISIVSFFTNNLAINLILFIVFLLLGYLFNVFSMSRRAKSC